MYIGLHIKYRLFLSNFNVTWILLTDFSKILKESNFIKICPAGAKLFHVDRQTMTQLIVTFRNFANMAKINHHVRFQASTTVQLRPLLFRDVTQCRYIVGYRGFTQPIGPIFKDESMFSWCIMFIYWCWASLCHMSSRYHNGIVYI
jgi:hypothetical protein